MVSKIKGDDHDVWDTQVQQVPVFAQEHTMVLDFQVMNMSHADVILWREWLHRLGSSLHRSYEHNTITFTANGKHVLFIGERNVPPTPLICTAELSFLQHSNQIEEVYFVTVCLEVLNVMWMMLLLVMNLPQRCILFLYLLNSL